MEQTTLILWSKKEGLPLLAPSHNTIPPTLQSRCNMHSIASIFCFAKHSMAPSGSVKRALLVGGHNVMACAQFITPSNAIATRHYVLDVGSPLRVHKFRHRRNIQCHASIRMYYIYPPIINPSIYPFTYSARVNKSKPWLWYISPWFSIFLQFSNNHDSNRQFLQANC